MIKFDEENHKYFDEETGRVLISVTQLLKKHFLSPDYRKESNKGNVNS